MRKLFMVTPAIMFLSFIFFSVDVQAAEVSNPKIILSSYSVDENAIVGEETYLHLEFTNMSKKYDMSEILITYNSSNNTISPIVGATNQFYIDTIGRSQTASIDLPIIMYSDGNGYALANFNISYTFGDIHFANNSSYIMFPIQDVGKLSFSNVNISETSNVGAKTMIGISYTNDSSAPVYNAKIHMYYEGNDKIIELGKIASEKTGYAENSIVFNSEGNKSISISLTYEDESGNETTVQGATYSVQVGEKIENYQNENDITETSNQNTLLFSKSTIKIIGVIAVIIIVMLITIIMGKRKK